MELNEQEITNAVCLHFAERKQVGPEQFDVQLLWDEDLGFSAEIWMGEKSHFLVEANLVEAIGRYLLNRHDMRIYSHQVRFELKDEIVAIIE